MEYWATMPFSCKNLAKGLSDFSPEGLSNELDIVGAGVEVLVGEVEVDLRGVGSGRTNSAGSGDLKWCGGFPPTLRLSDRSEGDVGEGNSHSELCRVCPQPLSTFCICAARQGPTTISWLAPPIRARDQTGLRLDLMPLDARWGQSNSVQYRECGGRRAPSRYDVPGPCSMSMMM
jgi:hypothetical protein